MKSELNRSINRRIYFLIFLVIILGAAVIGRLFWLQIYRGDYYANLAEAQRNMSAELLPDRGEIFAQDKTNALFPLAINEEKFTLYLVPAKIKEEDDSRVISAIRSEFDIEEDKIKTKIAKKDDPYEPLLRGVPGEKKEKFEKKGIAGIGFLSETSRFYPAENVTSHLTGFWGFNQSERAGRYGLEGYYEEELKGRAGILQGERNASGNSIPIAENFSKPPTDGSDLVLTIDKNIQFFIADALQRRAEKFGAEGGGVIVMEPKTGKILGMSSVPNFNPNHYNEVEKIRHFINPLVQNRFEPGSVFKAITMAAALDTNSITPNTEYEDEGYEKISGYTLRNSDNESHGIQTMTSVLELSLNTGAIFAYRETGMDNFLEYVSRFGFDEKTGIDLTGEIAGDISNLRSYRDINYATASFGQGIAVTPVELVGAVGAIANQGKLMRPYIVDKIVNFEGTKETESKIKREVIKKDTANRLTAMLVSAVDNGYGNKAVIPGYFVAGKTGTAQVSKEGSAGYSEKTIHSFVGYAPAYNPRFVVLVKLDNPKGVRFASDSVGPLFNEISTFLLNYLEIEPTRK